MLLVGHQTAQHTQSDRGNPSCPPCFSLSLFHIPEFLLWIIHDNRRRAAGTAAEKVDRWYVHECVLACEFKRPCVGQRGSKVVPYITGVPAILHNTHNTGTLMSSLACLKLKFTFSSLSSTFHFLPFIHDGNNLDFHSAFSCCYVCLESQGP